jgi:hypothetical protein
LRSELRSKANYIEPSAITYAARTTFTRGKSIPTDPTVWVPGGDPELNEHVQKWVSDPSTAADIAHILSGYNHPGREDQKLEYIPLEAYRGVRPTWWPPGDETWVNSPNNSLDTAMWASVCTSACVRDHHDTVNIVLVDLLATEASCSCYAWEDTSGLDHNASHSAPSDAQLMDWMHDSTRIVDSLADESVHAKLSTYAVHQRVGNDFYSSGLQSTVYYAQILSSEYEQYDTSFNTATALFRPNTFNDCMYQCFNNALSRGTRSIQWYPAYTDENGNSHPSGCYCLDEDLGESTYGHLWRVNTYNHGTWKPYYYSVKLCTNVRASDERSIVYSKRNDGFCPGVPVVTGYTLASHSLLTVGTAGENENNVPFDVRCRKLCMEDDECGVAHIYASTFAYHDLANRCAAFLFSRWISVATFCVCLLTGNHRLQVHRSHRRRLLHEIHRSRRYHPRHLQKSAGAIACGGRVHSLFLSKTMNSTNTQSRVL